ncbi:PTS fructose-like transporter subunit IIB [Burkholderia oklahomensis]|uniref:PTS fructose-like transporter subunit IIB n=3 Tax=Burkholderia oklahomensis TaxID=342113 RepID=UPI0005D789E3|nr:PTS fructose-like transporter subunit IIB [Burkholderia oklahomensis]AJX34304.1 PTS system fructose-specific EIIBC component [Burkholderia oklahomensis C6786]AOI48696.1 PTS fructose transporter subunit IIBC [Burkholderia oklahomensis C6786]KUY47482.1 PTS fructose transporter subunit IIBC [Burkholderia oklahomensis C6786]MBI0363117.1 PTS fructose-like transporter subunit IIB [Burkholderia oklahomensis]SUY27221.1 EIIBC-Fru [Burkholderia oklahomensis]
MEKLIGLVAAPARTAAPTFAAHALNRAARARGIALALETRSALGVQTPLSADQIGAASVVLIAADDSASIDEAPFAGKTIHRVSVDDAIRDADAVLARAAGRASDAAVAAAFAQTANGATPVGGAVPAASRAALQAAGGAPAASLAAARSGVAEAPRAPAAASTDARPLKIVAITSCPTGIAHTFMAAEGLAQGAQALGHAIHVETQGSVGAQNKLTDAQIDEADLVVIAADTQVDKSRFKGKRLYETGTKGAIGKGAALIERAIVEARIEGGAAAGAGAGAAALADQVAAAKQARAAKAGGPYRHLMTGVSYMLPFVVAGGLLIALSFALGGIYAFDDAHKGTLAWSLFQIGAKSAFALIVPVLSGYIAYSIADRPGITPGMVGGMLAASLNAGFLGGIASGFLAGYAALLINRHLKLHRNLEGLKPVLIIPLVSTLIVGLLMIYVVGSPVAAALHALEGWLRSMQAGSAVVLGLILGGMMAVDMGGPVNKAAYAFSAGLIASHVYTPMAATMAAGMTPPLGIALATWLFRQRFGAEEREAGKAAAVLGIAFITEGAIPFAARDPMRVIPACIAGSAVTGAISMAAGAELKVPHGGIFVLPIPNAVTHLGVYALAIVVGTLVTAVAVGALKQTPRPAAAGA